MLFQKIRRVFDLIMTPLLCAGGNRHLLGVFIVRDVKGRFAGSIGGVCWTLINPLATIVIYLFVFSLVLRVQATVAETGTDSFGIYLLSGLFPWLIFSEGLSRSAGCLIQNANLITKVVFPVELLPVGAVTASLVINGIGMVLFLGYLLIAGYGHLTWLLLFLLIPILMIFTWGIASLLAAASVFIRDIPELLAIILMVLFFATPIIYPASMIPAGIRPFMALNPISIFISLFRDALLLHQTDWLLIAQAGILALISYCIGSWFFVRAKPAFGDVL